MSSTVSYHPRRISARLWAAAAAVGGAALLSGCVVAPLDDGYTDYGYTSTTVYTTYGHPPPPRVEYRYAAPSPTHIWVGGDWFWGGSRYDWRPGYWAPPGYRPVPRPPHPGYAPRPPVRPMPPTPSRPSIRPDEHPRPPHWRPDGGQRPSQVQPPVPSQPPIGRPDRPRPGADRPQILPSFPSQPGMERPDRPRPPHMRPDGAERPRPEMRPDRPRPEARPAGPSDAGESRRPFPRRERDHRDD